MADEKKDKEEFPEDDKPLRDLTSDSGLGNLPPLSDFDSQTSGGDSDSGGLPPLSDIDADEGTPSEGAVSDIDVETPGAKDELYSSGGAADTPESPTPGTGFQDLAADSDFSPETPEIGPGPDSNLDTPMFDSAFGGPGAGDQNMSASLDTPAPTQAMETPMFGGTGAPTEDAGDSGFDAGGPVGGGFDMGDDGGFDAGGGMNFDAGTPAPDFSPDTGMGGAAPPPATGGDRGAGGGGMSPLVVGGIGIAALVLGMVLGPLAIGGFLPGIINPQKAQVESLQTELTNTNNQLQSANRRASAAEEELRRIQEQSGGQADPGEDPVAKAREAREELERLTAEIDTKSAALSAIEQDVLDKNEEFLQAQEMYEDLQNQTAIISARQKGLVAEVERLTNYVGQLEDANTRRIASRDALATAVDRLYIEVKEGLPLTPEKYDHAQRVRAVERLRDQVDQSNWVSPELQNAYTDLYLKELEISQASEYFFAKLRVTDEFGNKTAKWSECVMQGNWGVLYRTLDGKNVGQYTRIDQAGVDTWGYLEELDKNSRKAIEDMVFASRVDDFEEKIAVIAAKQLAAQDGTSWQRSFSSL